MATLMPLHRYASARAASMAAAWVIIFSDVFASRAAATVASWDNDAEFNELWSEVFGPDESSPRHRHRHHHHGIRHRVSMPGRRHHRLASLELGTAETVGLLGDKPSPSISKGQEAAPARALVASSSAHAAESSSAHAAEASTAHAAESSTAHAAEVAKEAEAALAEASEPVPAGQAAAAPGAAPPVAGAAASGHAEETVTLPPHAVQDVYPRTHPVVGHIMENGMESNIINLKDKESARNQAQQRLASASNEAILRMNDAVHLQRTIEVEKAEVKHEDAKLQELEEETEATKQRHDELEAKVRAIVEPRIMNMEERVEQRRAALEKAQEDVKEWTTMIEKYKSQAVSTLEDRNKLREQLTRAEDELDKATRMEAESTKLYQDAKNKASHDVEVYKYAYAHFEARRAHKEAQEEATDRETKSLEKMRSILKMQEHRIDSALAARKDHLSQEVRQTTAARDAAVRALQLEKKQFAGWKAAQRERVHEAAQRREEYDQANQAFTDERAHTLNSANSKAARGAENADDWAWDDWAWSDSDHDGDYSDMEMDQVNFEE